MAEWLRHILVGMLVFTLALSTSLVVEMREQREQLDAIAARQRTNLQTVTERQDQILERQDRILELLEQQRAEGEDVGG